MKQKIKMTFDYQEAHYLLFSVRRRIDELDNMLTNMGDYPPAQVCKVQKESLERIAAIIDTAMHG